MKDPPLIVPLKERFDVACKVLFLIPQFNNLYIRSKHKLKKVYEN
jgi:hypothetical protein